MSDLLQDPVSRFSTLKVGDHREVTPDGNTDHSREMKANGRGYLWESAGQLGSSKMLLVFLGMPVIRASNRSPRNPFRLNISRYELMISTEPMNVPIATGCKLTPATDALCTNRLLVDTRTSSARFKRSGGSGVSIRLQDHEWKKKRTSRLFLSAFSPVETSWLETFSGGAGRACACGSASEELWGGRRNDREMELTGTRVRRRRSSERFVVRKRRVAMTGSAIDD